MTALQATLQLPGRRTGSEGASRLHVIEVVSGHPYPYNEGTLPCGTQYRTRYGAPPYTSYIADNQIARRMYRHVARTSVP